MLGYAARVLPQYLEIRRRGPGGLVSRLDRRVRFRELDFNRHMNQAVYLQNAEMGRTDWAVRSGAWDRWRAQGVNAMVGEQRAVYRRELGPRVRYRIETRGVGVDGRLLMLQSHFLVGDRVHTLVESKLLFVGKDGVLPPEDVPALCEPFLTEPLPVEAWRVVAP
ncbi:MAG: hypothetical protein CMN30_09150 [Sandaracinus sp.]|nr:hypothetical protein [Sandaracinus sp.]|tara:strand:+ start:2072 stop:2566 length:495 start_codon:yes stop_codon:yes gene_type:complete